MPYTNQETQNRASVRYRQQARFNGRLCQVCGERPGEFHRASLEVRAISLCGECRIALNIESESFVAV